jgi:hypothetical protein
MEFEESNEEFEGKTQGIFYSGQLKLIEFSKIILNTKLCYCTAVSIG